VGVFEGGEFQEGIALPRKQGREGGGAKKNILNRSYKKDPLNPGRALALLHKRSFKYGRVKNHSSSEKEDYPILKR